MAALDEDPARSSRAAALEGARQAHAVELAVDQARKEARVDVILAEHTRNLHDLGDLVRKSSEDDAALATSVDQVRDSVEAIASELKTRDAVNLALIEAGKSRGQKKLIRLQMVGIAVGVLITVSSFLLAIVQAIAHA